MEQAVLESLADLPKDERYFLIVGKTEDTVVDYDYLYHHLEKDFFSFFINEKHLTNWRKSVKMRKKKG